jgi:hypothetical protein
MRLLENLSPRRPRLDALVGQREIFGGRSDIRQVSVRVLPFFSLKIVSSTLHTHFHLSITLTRRTSGQRQGTFKQSDILSGVGEHRQNCTIIWLVFRGLKLTNPRSWVLIERLASPRRSKNSKFRVFYGTRRFRTMLTKAQYLCLSGTKLSQFLATDFFETHSN